MQSQALNLIHLARPHLFRANSCITAQIQEGLERAPKCPRQNRFLINLEASQNSTRDHGLGGHWLIHPCIHLKWMILTPYEKLNKQTNLHFYISMELSMVVRTNWDLSNLSLVAALKSNSVKPASVVMQSPVNSSLLPIVATKVDSHGDKEPVYSSHLPIVATKVDSHRDKLCV